MANFLFDLAYDNIANVRIILSQFLCDLTKKEKFPYQKRNCKKSNKNIKKL